MGCLTLKHGVRAGPRFCVRRILNALEDTPVFEIPREPIDTCLLGERLARVENIRTQSLSAGGQMIEKSLFSTPVYESSLQYTHCHLEVNNQLLIRFRLVIRKGCARVLCAVVNTAGISAP